MGAQEGGSTAQMVRLRVGKNFESAVVPGSPSLTSGWVVRATDVVYSEQVPWLRVDEVRPPPLQNEIRSPRFRTMQMAWTPSPIAGGGNWVPLVDRRNRQFL